MEAMDRHSLFLYIDQVIKQHKQNWHQTYYYEHRDELHRVSSRISDQNLNTVIHAVVTLQNVKI